jgi:hypothetical protein
MEYLTENAIIDSTDEISDNIKRVQKILKLNRSYQEVIPGL